MNFKLNKKWVIMPCLMAMLLLQMFLLQSIFIARDALPIGIEKEEDSSHIKLSGFQFCKHLEQSVFDSVAYLQRDQKIQLVKQTNSINTTTSQQLVKLIDKTAKKLFSEHEFRTTVFESDLKRFMCYTVAMGIPLPEINFKGFTKEPFLIDVNNRIYFNDIIPNLYQKTNKGDKMKKYKLAYLIMVDEQNGFENLKLLVKKLNDNDAIILIHVDAKSEILKEKVKSWSAKLDNVRLSSKSYDGRWGHSSLVLMQMYGFFELLDIADWEYVINLSNYDWPTMSNQQIYSYLSTPVNQGKTWVMSVPDNGQVPVRLRSPHFRLLTADGGLMDKGLTKFRAQKVLPFHEFKAIKHHQWVVLTRDFVSFIRKDQVSLNVLAYYEYTFVPDESYFGSIIENNPYFKSRNINDNKRYHNFNGGPHPIWLTMESKNDLQSQVDENMKAIPFQPKYFFVRKVDAVNNQEFTDWLKIYPGF